MINIKRHYCTYKEEIENYIEKRSKEKNRYPGVSFEKYMYRKITVILLEIEKSKIETNSLLQEALDYIDKLEKELKDIKEEL